MEKTVKRSIIGYWGTKTEAQQTKEYAKSLKLTTSELIRQALKLYREYND
jgi:hypothetical protein